MYGNEFVLVCVINTVLFHKASHVPLQIFRSWGLGSFACVGLFVWVFLMGKKTSHDDSAALNKCMLPKTLLEV